MEDNRLEPVNEGAIGIIVKGILVYIGICIAIAASIIHQHKKIDKWFKDNPQVKKAFKQVRDKCREAIKTAAGEDSHLIDVSVDGGDPGYASRGSKVLYMSDIILEVDYEKILKELGAIPCDDYRSGFLKGIIVYKSSLKSSKYITAMKKELSNLKKAVAFVEESLKKEPNGDLISLSVETEYAVDDDNAEDEYRDSDDEFEMGQTSVIVTMHLDKLTAAAKKKRPKKPANEGAVYTMIDGNTTNFSRRIIAMQEATKRAEEEANDPPREEQKKALSDLEFSYDKKYNAFCLSVSGYSVNRLQSTLDKKMEELNSAKADKKAAKTRYQRTAAQIKVDYLNNVIGRCKTIINKKKS